MSKQHWKGPTIPGAGDPLLESWQTYTDTAGIIGTMSSVAAARVALTQAPVGAVTPTTPAYFDIGGIIYRADGTKNNSVWVLKPINEVEVIEAQDTGGGWSGTLALDAYRKVVTADLPIRPYDRLVKAWGYLYGAVTGSIDTALYIGTDYRRAAVATGRGSGIVINTGIIRAGVTPSIHMGPMGGWQSGGSIALSGASSLNSIIVEATPISMA